MLQRVRYFFQRTFDQVDGPNVTRCQWCGILFGSADRLWADGAGWTCSEKCCDEMEENRAF